MATLKEALKELYDSFVEENQIPTAARQGSMSTAQNEAAKLYAAAVARASGSKMTQGSQPAAQMPKKPMTSRLVVEPDTQEDTVYSPEVAATAKETVRPDMLSVLNNLTPDQVIQGIVLSEILGKPVSRRKGSNRIGR